MRSNLLGSLRMSNMGLYCATRLGVFPSTSGGHEKTWSPLCGENIIYPEKRSYWSLLLFHRCDYLITSFCSPFKHYTVFVLKLAPYKIILHFLYQKLPRNITHGVFQRNTMKWHLYVPANQITKFCQCTIS